jgi:hypothetical protein
MSEAAVVLDSEIREQLRAARNGRETLGRSGFALELWEALLLVRSEGAYFHRESDRLAAALQAGRPAHAGGMLVDTVERQRRNHGRLAQAVRALLAETPLSPGERETARALLLATPAGRSEAEAWAARPFPPAVVQGARALLAVASHEDLPPDLNPELLEDLRHADRFRRLGAELWEALSLALRRRADVAAAVDRLRAPELQARAADLNAGVVRVFEDLLEIRARDAALARALRAFVAALPIGSYGPETLDLAVAFLLVSPEGRSRAVQWLEDPARFAREAAIRVEGVIGKAQKYQAALRAA